MAFACGEAASLSACFDLKADGIADAAEGGNDGAVGAAAADAATGCGDGCGLTVPYESAQVFGDLNVVILGWSDSTADVASVNDTMGNRYVRALAPTTFPGFGSLATYYARNIAAADPDANGVTAMLSKPLLPYDGIRILEYRGLDTSAPLDVAGGSSGDGTIAATGPLLTSRANDLLVVADMVTDCASETSAGFTGRDTSGCDLVEDRIAATAGSYDVVVPLTDAGAWLQQMVAFKPLPRAQPGFVQNNSGAKP